MSATSPPPAARTTTSPEQRRAAYALQRVDEIKSKDAELQRSYRSYVERIGTTILTNGLGQALATELAAAGGSDARDPKKHAHRALYENLQGWLCEESRVVPGKQLLKALVTISQTDYLRAQAEALAWLVWHKKLCRALLPRGPVQAD